MLLLGVNVLVYAHRADATDHVRYREWLERLLVTERDYARFPGLRFRHPFDR